MFFFVIPFYRCSFLLSQVSDFVGAFENKLFTKAGYISQMLTKPFLLCLTRILYNLY